MDNFEAKQKQLIKKLRQICDRKGKECNPKSSAVIFNQLALLYKEKSPDKISLLQSAALLNAALARQPHNEKFQEDLANLCTHVLDCAKAKQRKCLVTFSNNVAKEVAEMRAKVKKGLSKIRKIAKTANDSNRLSMEQENVKQVSLLQSVLSADYKRIMASISRTCIDIMGHPPCKYALVGMGSLARKEISPFSDFEHVVVLQNHQSTKKFTNAFKCYFRWYSVIFHVIVLNLRETILPAMCIPGLNDSSTRNGNWFYDAITTRGISFDGMMPHACKFPLGRTRKTKNKPFTTELIKPINEMVKYLTTEEDLKNGYKLSEVLTQTCFVEGNEDVYEMFRNEANKVTEQNFSAFLFLLKQLKEDAENYNLFRNLNMFIHSKSINIKRIVYRSVTLFISALGRLFEVGRASSFEIIAELKSFRRISENTANRLSHAVSVACLVRLSHYMLKKRQDDDLYQDHEVYGREKLKDLTKNVSQECLVKCLVTAYALQKFCESNLIIMEAFDFFLQEKEFSFYLMIMNHLGLQKQSTPLCDAYLADDEPLNCDVHTAHELLRTYLHSGQLSKFSKLLEKINQPESSVIREDSLYSSIKVMEINYFVSLGKYSQAISEGKAALNSGLMQEDSDKFSVIQLIGKSNLNLKNYRHALSNFRDCKQHFFKIRYFNIGYAKCICYISLSLLSIGRAQQSLHWAREGKNLLAQINATEDFGKRVNFVAIIDAIHLSIKTNSVEELCQVTQSLDFRP